MQNLFYPLFAWPLFSPHTHSWRVFHGHLGGSVHRICGHLPKEATAPFSRHALGNQDSCVWWSGGPLGKFSQVEHVALAPRGSSRLDCVCIFSFTFFPSFPSCSVSSFTLLPWPLLVGTLFVNSQSAPAQDKKSCVTCWSTFILKKNMSGARGKWCASCWNRTGHLSSKLIGMPFLFMVHFVSIYIYVQLYNLCNVHIYICIFKKIHREHSDVATSLCACVSWSPSLQEHIEAMEESRARGPSKKAKQYTNAEQEEYTSHYWVYFTSHCTSHCCIALLFVGLSLNLAEQGSWAAALPKAESDPSL